jgi:hypothetical protein
VSLRVVIQALNHNSWLHSISERLQLSPALYSVTTYGKNHICATYDLRSRVRRLGPKVFGLRWLPKSLFHRARPVPHPNIFRPIQYITLTLNTTTRHIPHSLPVYTNAAWIVKSPLDNPQKLATIQPILRYLNILKRVRRMPLISYSTYYRIQVIPFYSVELAFFNTVERDPGRLNRVQTLLAPASVVTNVLHGY